MRRLALLRQLQNVRSQYFVERESQGKLITDRSRSTLSLQHSSFPDDLIRILYRKQDNSYHEIGELSMGEKADALLMIALGDSQMPVVIDQWEDALDVSSIWDDICQRLRTSK